MMINRTTSLTNLFCLLLLTGSAATAAPVGDLSGGQTGVIDFYSITPPGIYQLITKVPAPQTAITGTLTFPAAVSGKMPAMIVAHHCGGVTKSVTDLAALLNQMGVATFVLDSFTPRGFPSGICTSSVKPPHTVAVADALFALKLLATHPNIDPSRIGIIGQSFGGTAVYTTAFEEVRKSIITDQLKFAAHIGLYPTGCNARNWSPNMTGAPMLILLGGADDWTPAAACMDFDVLLRSLGTPTTAIVYPDAPHAWDSPGPVNYNANRGSVGNCRFQFRLDTLQSSRYDTGQILGGTATTDYINSCTTFGASQGRHEVTIPLASADITAFLTNAFNLNGLGTAPAPTSTVPVYEFYHTTLDHYFRTSDAGEATGIDNGAAGPGWVRTGDNFLAYPASSFPTGAAPVCRFYGSVNPGPNSHFYTSDKAECDGLKALQASTPATQKRWNYEGLAFAIVPGTGTTCASGLKPVYRLYNNGHARGEDSNHRYTTLQTEYARLQTGIWKGEGVVMCAAG